MIFCMLLLLLGIKHCYDFNMGTYQLRYFINIYIFSISWLLLLHANPNLRFAHKRKGAQPLTLLSNLNNQYLALEKM